MPPPKDHTLAWASVQRWNANTVVVQCPFCGREHTHGFGHDYTSIRRAAHCSNSSSLSFPSYRFRYPFSKAENTVAYEIDKHRGLFVSLATETFESNVEELGTAFNDLNLSTDRPSERTYWKDAREMITIDMKDEIFCRLHQHFGGDDTFTLRRLDHVVSRMIFGDHRYVENYIKTSPEVNIFLLGTDDNGNSALNLAACEKHSEIVKLLLNTGADVNHRNDAGRSPLMEAALWGRIENAKHLLKHGANSSFCDINGRQAADFAIMSLQNDEERYVRSGQEAQAYKEISFLANKARRVILEMLRSPEDHASRNVIPVNQGFRTHSFKKTSSRTIELVAPVAKFPVPNEWKTVATLHRPSNYPLVAAMSGWGHVQAAITISGRDWTSEVMRISRSIQYPLHIDERDRGNPGQFLASHAEKQLVACFISKHVLVEVEEENVLLEARPPVLLQEATILVSRPPCTDCVQFVNAVNAVLGLSIAVSDRSG